MVGVEKNGKNHDSFLKTSVCQNHKQYLVDLPDSMAQIRYASVDGMVIAGIAM